VAARLGPHSAFARIVLDFSSLLSREEVEKKEKWELVELRAEGEQQIRLLVR
jgi:hypothetical protein